MQQQSIVHIITHNASHPPFIHAVVMARWWGGEGQGPATTGSSRSVLKTNATKLACAWLEGLPKKKDPSDCAFMGDKILAKLFIRYNKAIYSLCYIQNVTVTVTEK
jgi:hypothetical protein